MAFEQKDGSGALFKNDKAGNEKRPDYRGDLTVGGVTYEIAAWIKEGNKGKFMSLSAKPKEARESTNASRSASAPKAPQSAAGGMDSDDIPFAPFERRSAV